MNDIHIKGKIWTQTCTRGKGHVNLKVEVRVMEQKSGNTGACQQATRSSETDMEQIHPQALKGTSSADISILNF